MTIVLNGTTGITTPGTDSTTLVVNSNNISAVNSLGFRNRIINGGMVIDQRNAGASVTITNTSTATYTLDRWQVYGSAASKFSVQQNAAAVTPPAGFKNYLGVTSLAATSLAAGDQYYVGQYIEGYNVADMGFGAAGASTFTISFWVRSSLTGTFGGSVANSAFNRSYPFTYTISAANTWEQKTVTIAGDTSGTWLSTNGIGLQVNFGIGVGTTLSGTANAWAGAAYVSSTGATSVVGTNGATFYITGVQLEAGSVASPFERRDYGRELMMCQRYCQVLSGGGNLRYFISGNGGSTSVYPTYYFKTSMRAAPSFSYSSVSHFTFENFSSSQQTLTSLGLNVASTESITVTGGFASSSSIGGNIFGNNSSAQVIISAEL